VHADDLVADAVLDPAIRPPGSSVAPARLDHGVVLLTGVTGFFGVFVLRDLLRKTSGAIHCLVRAGDADDARARIAAAWLRAIGGDVELPDRVVPVAGDLAKPKLGMSDAQWDGIADAADVLVHAGALVSYLLPYRSLRSANVLGTEEILRLAAHRKPKTVHYVSTVDVAHATGRLAPENDELASAAMLADGYAQSKWVAERLAAIGRERGIPVTVYRPGRLVGDSQTGAANQNDFLLRVVQACVRAGAAPRLDVQTDMTPVDYASAALVALAGAGPVGRVYHLVNPAPVAWDDLVRALGEFGYRIATMPFADWTNVLRRSARRAGASGDAFGTYLAGLDEHRVRAALEAVHGCERTVAELERHAVRCPAVDGQVLRMYFTRLVRSGFFPPPL
jgi:thioester reductase-like protein